MAQFHEYIHKTPFHQTKIHFPAGVFQPKRRDFKVEKYGRFSILKNSYIQNTCHKTPSRKKAKIMIKRVNNYKKVCFLYFYTSLLLPNLSRIFSIFLSLLFSLSPFFFFSFPSCLNGFTHTAN